MKKLFKSSIFLSYLFILFFVIINVYLIFQIDIDALFDSYIMIYSFWFLIIIVLYIIAKNSDFKEDKDV